MDAERRISDLEAQSKRFASHLQSEQRVYNQHGERLTEQGTTLRMISDTQVEIKQRLDKIDDILRNGNGVMIRLDRLEQKNEGNKWRWMLWVAVLSAAASAASVIISLSIK